MTIGLSPIGAYNSTARSLNTADSALQKTAAPTLSELTQQVTKLAQRMAETGASPEEADQLLAQMQSLLQQIRDITVGATGGGE